MRHLVLSLSFVVSVSMFCPLSQPAMAEESGRVGLAKPVTIATTGPDTRQVSHAGGSNANRHAADRSAAEASYPSTAPADLPTSVTRPSGVLSLATGGPAVLPELPLARGGCQPRPAVRCTGPCYRGCTPPIYYGTDPTDDDPVLSMSPTVCDACTTHWYEHALRMILRKKAITEAYRN
ncbi:hypothetical protein [Roseimaritima sediminicola]|uniref:hypothetical protein n=1 Tax=Roseimaritima sediminicola TaxID=2662066 RepID=UPI0012982CFF|nr:hypothetical protein [Roseimaritima sediminicola]